MHNDIPLMSCDHNSATWLGCSIHTPRTRKQCHPFDQTLSCAWMKGAGHETRALRMGWIWLERILIHTLELKLWHFEVFPCVCIGSHVFTMFAHKKYYRCVGTMTTLYQTYRPNAARLKVNGHLAGPSPSPGSWPCAAINPTACRPIVGQPEKFGRASSR